MTGSRAPFLEESDEDVFTYVKRYYGKIMYRFVLSQVNDVDLAKEIFARAMQQLSFKKDLVKVLAVIEPWLAVFFHNFCKGYMENREPREGKMLRDRVLQG